MRGTRRVLPVLLLWSCLPGFVMPALGGEAQWVEIRSPHFSVATDAGEKRGREVAMRFEQMRAVFGALLVKAKVTTPIPLQIIAFRSSKELRQVSPLFRGKPTEMAGLFQAGQDRCFIMLDMSVDNPWQVVFHEYAHQLMNGTLSGQVDPWFEEGFAEYFSSIEVDGKEARVGKIPDEEYLVLEHMGWMKVADLFRVRQNTATYNESGDHRNVFYAESGMLVHYLYDNKLILKVGDYFNLELDQHVPVDDAIQRAFGMNATQFDKALRSYESSGHYKYYPMATPPGINSNDYSAAPLSSVDAAAILADVHLHSPDYQAKAAEEFEAILRTDPNNAAALRGLGYSYLIKRNFAKAGEYFTQAAEHNANDPRVFYYSALMVQQQGGFPSGNDERLETVQKHLESAVKLDPEFADAYSLLAFTYQSGGKKDLAIATMIKAIELNPRNEPYRFNLAQMYLDSQNFDSATAILDSLKNSNNPEIAEHASEEVAQVETYRREAREREAESRDSNRQAEGTAPANGYPGVIEPEATGSNDAVARFLKGKLVNVDCAAAPGAMLTIVAGTKTWKLHTANGARMIVIGADKLACDWTNQKVAVNYRATGDGTGEVISLEVQ
jgi:tetratricopeptide (TPR) repeat protein